MWEMMGEIRVLYVTKHHQVINSCFLLMLHLYAAFERIPRNRVWALRGAAQNLGYKR